MRDSKDSIKFMQVLDRTIFLRLSRIAKARGVTVQELIRVIVIPYWMLKYQEDFSTEMMTRRQRSSRQRRLRHRPVTVGVSPARRPL
jgi:hypothetical protein